MDTNLKASLDNLHAQLAAGGPVDEELTAQLSRLDGDIQQLLARRANAADGANEPVTDPATGLATIPADTSTYGLAERTQEISAKFAAEHPKLEPALRELGYILSNLGI
jgi:hypothetical protein